MTKPDFDPLSIFFVLNIFAVAMTKNYVSELNETKKDHPVQFNLSYMHTPVLISRNRKTIDE